MQYIEPVKLILIYNYQLGYLFGRSSRNAAGFPENQRNDTLWKIRTDY